MYPKKKVSCITVQYPVRTIDLSVLRENVRLIRDSLPAETKMMAVVKANGYGHGIVQTARNALHAGAEWLAVARTYEGELLRQAGIEAPILVLGAGSGDELGIGVRHGLTLTVTDPRMIHAVQRWAAKEDRKGYVHLKLDTGMARIGVRSEAEIRAMLQALDACPDVCLTGVFTHFADADGASDNYTREQFQRFMQLSSMLPAGVIRHCANSAAIHRYPETALDMVRAGISMYGYPPVETSLPLRPVMEWRTAVTYVKRVNPGEKVSYGCTFTAEKPMILATVACGYGDGYHRLASGNAEVIIRGRKCKVVGRICMDQMMADVTDLPDVVPGDEVILIGQSGNTCITAEDVAEWNQTISYEVLLAATERVHSRWINDCDDKTSAATTDPQPGRK